MQFKECKKHGVLEDKDKVLRKRSYSILCRICINEYSLKYYHDNKEKLSSHARFRLLSNDHQCRIHGALKLSEVNKLGVCKKCKKDKYKVYYAMNKEAIAKQKHQWYLKNKERLLEKHKLYIEGKNKFKATSRKVTDDI